MIERKSGLAKGVLLLAAVAGCGDPNQEMAGRQVSAKADYPVPIPGSSMELVPAGPFQMGCNLVVDTECCYGRPGSNECMSDELPYHSVNLSAFLIDRTEVTQAAYEVCIEAGACAPPRFPETFDPVHLANYPVVSVSWYDADAYCKLVGLRLLTEAEWEKAARGTDGRKYPWGNDALDCDRANLEWCGHSLSPVDSHPAGVSPYGALNMAGNAEEWVSDWYDAAYYSQSQTEDPRGPVSGTAHVRRGGGIWAPGDHARVSNRPWTGGHGTQGALGFRCAKSLP